MFSIVIFGDHSNSFNISVPTLNPLVVVLVWWVVDSNPFGNFDAGEDILSAGGFSNNGVWRLSLTLKRKGLERYR